MTSGRLPAPSVASRIVSVHPLALVGLGGAVGSVARHIVVSGPADPSIAVLLLNVVGSLALGSITAWLQHARSSLHGDAGEAKPHWAALLGLGVCGGLTTFSTYMVDVAQQLDSSGVETALLSLLGTAVAAIAAAAAGYELTRRATHPGTGDTR